MTAPAKSTLALLPAGAAPAATSVVATLIRLWTRFQNRRDVTRLLALDDHMLKDLGIARGDVFEALSEPMVADPSELLAASASERRIAERARARESLRSVQVMDDAEKVAAARGRALAA
jgi:uncharacterized protein YjiS (DUF1127 family)